jgi:SAM-dependent methyltransferase
MEKNKGFTKDYWDKNYSDLEVMDGIFNATSHARYVKGYFDVEEVELKSIIDLGFGLGYLFREFIKIIKPNYALGLEPSSFAFAKGQKLLRNYKVKLKEEDILSWAIKNEKKIYDLGICTSVFQYLKNEEINQVLPHISKKVRFLYFSVPTDIEQDRLKKELDFVDPYAIRRSKQEYLDLIGPYFTIVSSRILESKAYFGPNNTHLTDLLFRF